MAICIATRNRCEELARTLAEIARLAPQPDEVLVAADGCTDGTLEMLRADFPKVRVIVHEQALGSIPSRNELAAATTCAVMLSLDDDSHPIEPDFIAHVIRLFATRPGLAVVSFPQRTDEFPATLTAQDFGPSHFAGSYANSGAAIRRAAFVELGGYLSEFGHMYEEPDFALRCVCSGWEVWHETMLTIRHHFTASQRSELRNHQRHARNELWSVLLRCPAPQVLAVVIFRAVRQLGYAWSRGWTWAIREPQWWCAFLAGVPRCLAARTPLPWARYRAWMGLVRKPIADEAEWRAKFGNAAA